MTVIGRVEHLLRVCLCASLAQEVGRGAVLCPCWSELSKDSDFPLMVLILSVLFLAQVLKGQDLSVSSYCIHDRTKHNTECGNATQSLLSSSLVKGLKTQPVGMVPLFMCPL